MKATIEVVGAAFIRQGKLFAARRSYGSEYVIHKYEFVGGKKEPGECGECAVVRECAEELGAKISVLRTVGSTSYEYPDKAVNITVYLCELNSAYELKEHEEGRWLSADELDEREWAPADVPILAIIKSWLTAEYALITGATGYIGKAFCMRLAARGENLFITGRSSEKLAALAAEIKARYPETDIKYYPCDLSDDNSRGQFFANAAGYRFCRLVNVAGADIQKAFEKYGREKIIFQSRVLFESAVLFTRFCLENRAEKLSVINICSITGLYPIPYFAIYSSLKGALVNFSVALGEELKGSGVTVTAVLPGAVYTRPDVVEYIKKQGLWGRLAAKSPEFIAQTGLKAADAGKRKVIPGFANRAMRFFTALIPMPLKIKFMSKRWKRTEKDAF